MAFPHPRSETVIRQLTAADLTAFLSRPLPPVGVLVRVVERRDGQTLLEAAEFPEWGNPRAWISDTDWRDCGPAETEHRRRWPTLWQERFAGMRWIEVERAAMTRLRNGEAR